MNATKSGKVYWTMKNGQKIDVDEMDINHLRNTLKMIVRNIHERRERSFLNFKIEGETTQIALEPYEHGKLTGEYIDDPELNLIPPTKKEWMDKLNKRTGQ